MRQKKMNILINFFSNEIYKMMAFAIFSQEDIDYFMNEAKLNQAAKQIKNEPNISCSRANYTFNNSYFESKLSFSINTKSVILTEENRSDKIKVIEFRCIIGTHKEEKNICTARFIKELSDGTFLSAGTDCKIFIYNKNFKKIEEIDINNEETEENKNKKMKEEKKRKKKKEGTEEKERTKRSEMADSLEEMENIVWKEKKDHIYFICEKNDFEEKANNKIQLLVCLNETIILIEINYDDKTRNYHLVKLFYEPPGKACTNCVQMKNNEYVIPGLDGIYHCFNFFKNENNKSNEKIIDKAYRGAIKISDNLIALTSNSVDKGGEDSLIFYDSSKKPPKNIVKVADKKYSFVLDSNGLSLIDFDEKNKNNDNNHNKILLCACRKYLENQHNGILLVDPQIGDDKEAIIDFYDTGDFEVYCFCPIFANEEKNFIETEKKDTVFFLVGGFNNGKYEGKIRLYKILNEEPINVKIEYLQDIEIKRNDKFGGFSGAISNIIQSTKSGDILASCYDGNVYLFSPPNLDFYLEEN